MLYGSIARLVPEHGFGFVRDESGLDWFFVTAGVRPDALARLRVGERVGFEREWTTHGPRATDVHIEFAD